MYRGVSLDDRELERQVIAISGLFTIVFIRVNDATKRVQSSSDVISALNRFCICICVVSRQNGNTPRFILDKKVAAQFLAHVPIKITETHRIN